MPYVLICRDAPDSRNKRPAIRPEHLEYWKPIDEAGKILLAGPMTDFAGSLFILDADSDDQVAEWARNDPYTKGGVFVSHEIHPFKCVLPLSQYGTG